jgi:asparagine synthetase B (glutamine-hydrolysing)
MCGICGIVDLEGRPIDRRDVDRMRDAMRNRGPDDAGTEILPFVGLGHRRLSIIDLSPRGRQPMRNEDGTVWLVFNGEIYDFEPLRATLATAGHRFGSDSDSDVLVHGYEEWGLDGLLARINGMFAFAIWDTRRHALHLARDRRRSGPSTPAAGRCGRSRSRGSCTGRTCRAARRSTTTFSSCCPGTP